MKVYTYYDRVKKFPCQQDLIKLWKLSWTRQGFEPIVLSEHEARQHEFYDLYVASLRELHREITGKELEPYGLSCYTRWLAYAQAKDGEFLTCDYDIMNYSLEPDQLSSVKGSIYLMNAATPCLVYGSSKLFEKLCRMFIDVMVEKLPEWSKGVFSNRLWLHDQEFFAQLIFDDPDKQYVAQLFEKHNIKVNLDWGKYCFNYENSKSRDKYPTVHYSHSALDSSIPELRGQAGDYCEKVRKPSAVATKLEFSDTIDWNRNYEKNTHRYRIMTIVEDMETDV